MTRRRGAILQRKCRLNVWAELVADFEENYDLDDTLPDIAAPAAAAGDGAVPGTEEKFDCRALGCGDGDWPDWAEQRMIEWLPGDICSRYGTRHDSTINGYFIEFKPEDEAAIVAELHSRGYRCLSDDTLVKVACGE